MFKWLLEQTYDDKGSVIVNQYKKEDSQGVDVLQVNERNRTDMTRSANRYLWSIRYGNKAPHQPGPAPFEVIFPDSPKDRLFESCSTMNEHVLALPVDAMAASLSTPRSRSSAPGRRGKGRTWSVGSSRRSIRPA
jgi:hypothetical protein